MACARNAMPPIRSNSPFSSAFAAAPKESLKSAIAVTRVRDCRTAPPALLHGRSCHARRPIVLSGAPTDRLEQREAFKHPPPSLPYPTQPQTHPPHTHHHHHSTHPLTHTCSPQDADIKLGTSLSCCCAQAGHTAGAGTYVRGESICASLLGVQVTSAAEPTAEDKVPDPHSFSPGQRTIPPLARPKHSKPVQLSLTNSMFLVRR